jgi:hypothetical protein
VKDKEPTIRATLRLPEALWKKAQHYAIDNSISGQELVRLALEQYLKAQKGQRS